MEYNKHGRRSSGKRLMRERCLIFTIILLTIIILVLILGLLTGGFSLLSRSARTCTTQSCIQAASRILDNMDTSVDPCHDFYLYACGRYMKNRLIPPAKTTISPFHEAHDKMFIRLKPLLESPSNIDHLNAVKQMRIFYESCMNESNVEALGAKPLKEFVEEMGGWPLLKSDWNSAEFDLESLVSRVGIVSSDSIVSWSVRPSPVNQSQNVISLTASSLILESKENYQKPRKSALLRTYETLITNVAELLGGDAQLAKKDINDLIDFEIAVANIRPTDEEQYKTGEVMNLTRAREEFKAWDTLKLLNGYAAPAGVKLNASNTIVVKHYDYYLRLGDVIQRASNRTLANFIIWQGVWGLLEELDKQTRALTQDLKKQLIGSSAEHSRYTVCSNKVNWHFQFVTARLFADAYFKAGTTDITDMANRIKTVFKQDLEELTWLDEESRRGARKKVDAMLLKLAYPKYILNDTALEEIYDIQDMVSDEYAKNIMKLGTDGNKSRIRRLLKPVNRTEFTNQPLKVNAYSMTYTNSMVFLLGILQPPFYDINGPKYLNYGAIGMIIGHEITHGFDTVGRSYDYLGRRRDWMTEYSTKQFELRAKCVEEKYSNISVPHINMTINGKLTEAENIADIGATTQAFTAYQKWVQDNGAEQTLPGLDLTPNQLIFMSLATAYCHGQTRESLINDIRTEVHTPMAQRVYGILSNSVEFAEAFQCPIGSRMNPIKKCKVW